MRLYINGPMCRKKDDSSTQSSLGFKISGMCTWSGSEKCVLGKSECAAASANMADLLRSFADSRSGMVPRHVWLPVIEVIADISRWVDAQRGPSWHLVSVSLLVIYEGATTRSEHLRVRCGLVDFAHSFFVADGPDYNMLRALHSLRSVLDTICSRS